MKEVKKCFKKTIWFDMARTACAKLRILRRKVLTARAIQYYVLRLVYNDTSTIYGPLHNQTLTQNMRKVLSEEDLRPLIQTMPQEESLWIKNEEMRKARYQEILAGGNRADLIRMPKALYLHQREQQEKGRRLHMSDDHFLRKRKKCCMRSSRWCSAFPESRIFPIIWNSFRGEQKNCG